ncbi:MAG: NIPSNAP family protein [Chloroflexota bacterium]
MIYEIRTYGITVGSLAEVEKRFGEAYEQHRKKYSELAAFWHTDIGPLNEIIHIWPYKDLNERARIRAEASKNPNWPPKTGEFIRFMRSEILAPWPFSPQITPGKIGPLFEMRIYTVKPGALPDIMKGWEAKLPERMKLSPLVVVGTVEFGQVNQMIHIWAYNSFEQRAAVRAQFIKSGIWPPPGGVGRLITQESKIMMPSAFSPLQ